MAGIAREFTVVQRGIGAPDYSKTVSSAIERAGIVLKANQTLKMYGRNRTPADADYPFIPASPLAAGAHVHLTDVETLVDMPVTIPVGYTTTVVTVGHTVSQDAKLITTLDSLLAYCFAIAANGSKHYDNELVGLSTALYDADALASHTIDIKLFNDGLADLYGSVSVVVILEAVGTKPLPKDKWCQCPVCGRKQKVSVHDTRITCNFPHCGYEYIVYDLTKFRRTA